LQGKLHKLFKPIQFNTLSVVLDPLAACLFFPFEVCCKRRGCFLRPKILEKCEEKFTDELEVTNLLSKIRVTYDMLKNLLTNEQKLLLRYNKDRVIDLDSLSESSSSSSDSSQSSSDQDSSFGLNFNDPNDTDPEFDSKEMAGIKRSKVEKFLPSEFQNAFQYSILKGIRINKNERKSMIEVVKADLK